jgi:tetratricopeptide (TPR) repeat protein
VNERWRVALAVVAAALALGAPARAEDPATSPSGPPSPDGTPVAADREAGGLERVDQAWLGPLPLAERARHTRATALALGIWSFDSAGRALLADPSLGSPLERAEAAALLAPELPDAQLALARARLASGDLLNAGGPSIAALAALDRHPEASPWFRATLLDAAARTAIAGSLLFLALAGIGAAAGLVHPLAQRLGLPGASAGALLAAFALLPAAAGEGALGVGLACAGLAVARGRLGLRLVVVAGAFLALAGLHELAPRRDAALTQLARDPVGAAVSSAERDFASGLDIARLERAAADDVLARRALALHLRRSGDVAEADRRFRALVAEGDASVDALNNAANTRLAAGDADGALALYERAVHRSPTPLVLFNLAQAYGRAILLEEQDLALAQAQALDPRAIHALTQHVAEIGAGGPVDVPISAAELRARTPEEPRSPSALARLFAPGRLGGSWHGGLAGLAAAALGGLLTWLPLRRLTAGEDLYAGIARLLQGGDTTNPSLRLARLADLRARGARLARLRRLAAWLVPGAAALQGGQATLALASVLLASAAVAAWRARGGLVPDPLAAGDTAAFVFGASAFAALLAYLGALALSLALLRRKG